MANTSAEVPDITIVSDKGQIVSVAKMLQSIPDDHVQGRQGSRRDDRRTAKGADRDKAEAAAIKQLDLWIIKKKKRRT